MFTYEIIYYNTWFTYVDEYKCNVNFIIIVILQVFDQVLWSDWILTAYFCLFISLFIILNTTNDFHYLSNYLLTTF